MIKAEFFRAYYNGKVFNSEVSNAYLDLSTDIYIKFFHSIQRMPFIPTLKHRSLSNKNQIVIQIITAVIFAW